MDDYPLKLHGEGPVTKQQKHVSEHSGVELMFEATAEVGIEFTVEEFHSKLQKDGRGWLNIPRVQMKELIENKLKECDCELSTEQWNQWDVTLDGDVRGWVNLFENKLSGMPSMETVAERFKQTDEVGEGAELAHREMER